MKFPVTTLALGQINETRTLLVIFLLSTYFTSVWVWLFALSGLTVRAAAYFGMGISRLSSVLDIENKPLRSMGFVSIALCPLLWCPYYS